MNRVLTEFGVLLCICTVLVRGASPNTIPTEDADKYDLDRLPLDLGPVWYLVGTWVAQTSQKLPITSPIPIADVLDFGIGILPLFGARSLNYTGNVYDSQGHAVFTEYGYLIVLNKTVEERSAKTAFLTTSNTGYVALEEGLTSPRSVSYNLMSFTQRSIQLGRRETLISLKRTFTVQGDNLKQEIQLETTRVRQNMTNFYNRVAKGWPCNRACFYAGRKYSVKSACYTCLSAKDDFFRGDNTVEQVQPRPEEQTVGVVQLQEPADVILVPAPNPIITTTTPAPIAVPAPSNNVQFIPLVINSNVMSPVGGVAPKAVPVQAPPQPLQQFPIAVQSSGPLPAPQGVAVANPAPVPAATGAVAQRNADFDAIADLWAALHARGHK